VVDAHPLARYAIQRALAEGGVEVVGGFGDATAAVAGVLASRPDFVLVSFDLVADGALPLIRVLAEQRPEIRIIALLTGNGEVDAIAAVRAGADGVLSLDAGADALIHALVDVQPDEPLIARRYLRPLLAALRDSGETALSISELTSRENEVMALVARGDSDREIGERLVISTRTVESHVASILRKLNVHSRSEASRLARGRALEEQPAGTLADEEATR
jgi:two-component system nitrate/nitrite response regulator NarL